MNPSDNSHFSQICRAMLEPSFYPHPVTCIEKKETHISVVFLTGQWVYKVKKPVYLEFLDFRNLSDRKFACQQEIVLNQRLSSGVYLEVVKIYLQPDGSYGFEPKGEVVEYAVKMRQLPETACLKNLLKQHAIHSEHSYAIGQTLAHFYAHSPQNESIQRYGEKETISANMEENFRQLESFSGVIEHKEQWELICMVSNAFLKTKHHIFQKRIQQGFIRDGHGDLRTDHIYFDNGIQIIDCIEFNDRFRYGDAALDLSFLHMDLEHLGYPEISRQIIHAYMKESHDIGIYSVIDFYAAYRAIIRLKVYCLQLKSEQECVKSVVDRYIYQAYRYAIQFARPTLWLFCGLPGSGKSTLAYQIAEANQMQIFSSDRIRKQIQGGEIAITGYGQGEYSPDRRSRVYAHLLVKAQQELKEGRSVVIDASFSLRKWREEARQLAKDLDTDIIFVYCFCKETTLQSRLKAREYLPNISDARIEHLQYMKNDFDPISELPELILVSVSTDQPLPDALAQLVSDAYDRKTKQVDALL